MQPPRWTSARCRATVRAVWLWEAIMFTPTTLRLAAALLVAGVGCSGIGTLITYQPTAPPPRLMHSQPWQRVEFRDTPPKEPYTMVGVVQAEDSSQGSTRAIMQAMLRRAGEAGCDGVIWLGKTDFVREQTGSYVEAGSGGQEKVQGYRATCFLYNEPKVRAASTKDED
jgi:hypothetical protein